ncbi:MAG: AAA family ATPase [Proteobacteria bacterium]|nr:AAA family ATPase [Pseudomonadota bacterium]
MYSSHFGMIEKPFSIAPDPKFLYMSELHREALAHLLYGIKSDGGFVMLTGEVGTGKTTVCRCLLEQIPDDVDVAFVLNPKVTATELLATICDELDIIYPEGNTSIKIFVDRINDYLLKAHAAGRKTVLIIDEAQNLSADVLEQIRLLTNLETNTRKLLQIIMVGQPELNDLLEFRELRQLAQRVTARYHIGPLAKNEVEDYITHRLAIAGFREKIFPPAAITRIYNLSGGIPRLINILCDRALLGSYVQGQRQVNKQILNKAAREIMGVRSDEEKKTGKWLIAALIIIFASATFTGAYYFTGPERPFSGIVNGILTRKKVTVENPAPVLTSEEITPEPPTPESPTPESILPKPEDNLDWLNSPSEQNNKIEAYKVLFKKWGLTYAAQNPNNACDQALRQKIMCLAKRGSLGNVRHLNRPAILSLTDKQGQEFFAPLTALGETTATFEIKDEKITISTRTLELIWHGTFIILWRFPPEYHQEIHPGSSGPVITWLATKFAEIDGINSDSGKPNELSGQLLDRLRRFQLSEGLLADGIIGPETIIHLNNVTDHNLPTLIKKQKDT